MDGGLQLLADPVRWRVLQELGRSDRRVGELVDRTGKAQNVVSYHLRALRDAGLVTSRRSAADRRDTYYRVDVDRCRAVLAEAAAALHPALAGPPTPAPAPPRGRRRPTRVLFLCTGNSARSQMAEALLTHRGGPGVRARSAGSHPKPLHPNAVRVMAERGLDIAGRPSTHLDRFAATPVDLVVTLCDKVREVCPELPGGPEAVHWSMADPSAEGTGDEATYPAFVRTADELEVRIGLLLTRIHAEGGRRA